MIKTTSMLISELNNYKSPADKLSRMEKQGQVIQIIKGLYETNKDTAGYLLANSIYSLLIFLLNMH